MLGDCRSVDWHCLGLHAGSDGYQSSCPGCMVTCTQQEPGWKVYDAGQKPVRLFTHLMTDTMPPMMRVLLVVDSAWSGCCPADLQGGSCGDSSESKELGSVFNLAMGLSVDLKFPINSLIGQGAHGQVVPATQSKQLLFLFLFKLAVSLSCVLPRVHVYNTA